MRQRLASLATLNQPTDAMFTLLAQANLQAAKQDKSISPGCFTMYISDAGPPTEPFPTFSTITLAPGRAAWFNLLPRGLSQPMSSTRSTYGTSQTIQIRIRTTGPFCRIKTRHQGSREIVFPGARVESKPRQLARESGQSPTIAGALFESFIDFVGKRECDLELCTFLGKKK